MSEWKEYRLGDIINLKRGYDLSSEKRCVGPYPIVSSSGVTDFHSEYMKFPPGVVTGRYGTIGKVFYVKEPYWPLNTTLYVTDFKGNDPKFIYYFLQAFEFEKFNDKSTVPGINRNHLHSEIVSIPSSITEQQSIASILSSLDDKIDLLHRQNKTLEAMAEALFRKWFVEEAKEEWEEGRLDDILSIIESGSRPKGGIDPELRHGVPSIGAENINGIGNYEFSKTKFVTEEFFTTMKRGLILDYDVLIYKDGAYVGKKGMFGRGFPYKKCTVNEHVFILRSNNRSNQMFLYFLLQQDDLAQLNTNSAQPGLNQEAMRSFEIVIPPKELMDKFQVVTLPMINKILFNGSQIHSLIRLRDALLPKLMSGEVQVK